jgi:electron transfer flavoprotein beta subunit
VEILSVKILVCIKQVPDSCDTLAIDKNTCWVSYKPSTVFRMNRYDEFALEEALLIKETLPGTSVHALSVGPERACTTIRRALEMGADHGIHVLHSSEAYPSPFMTASLISSYARSIGYDLILTGVMSEDIMACQTGQFIAASLDMPFATSVIGVEFLHDERSVLVDREIEGGDRMSVRLDMPAVLTIQSGINTPRYPSLSNVLRARTQKQEAVRAEDLNPQETRETCIEVRYPDSASMGTFLEGSQQEKARELLRILREKAFIP